MNMADLSRSAALTARCSCGQSMPRRHERGQPTYGFLVWPVQVLGGGQPSLGGLDRGLARVGDVLRTLALEDLLSLIDFLAVLRMNGEQDIALEDLALVLLGLVFRNPQADECTRQTTGRRADSGSGQRRHDRARRDERTDA